MEGSCRIVYSVSPIACWMSPVWILEPVRRWRTKTRWTRTWIVSIRNWSWIRKLRISKYDSGPSRSFWCCCLRYCCCCLRPWSRMEQFRVLCNYYNLKQTIMINKKKKIFFNIYRTFVVIINNAMRNATGIKRIRDIVVYYYNWREMRARMSCYIVRVVTVRNGNA